MNEDFLTTDGKDYHGWENKKQGVDSLRECWICFAKDTRKRACGCFFTTFFRLEIEPNPAIFISHFEGEQPEVGPQDESRLGEMSRKVASRQLRRRSGLGKPANQMSAFLLGELYSSERNEQVK